MLYVWYIYLQNWMIFELHKLSSLFTIFKWGKSSSLQLKLGDFNSKCHPPAITQRPRPPSNDTATAALLDGGPRQELWEKSEGGSCDSWIFMASIYIYMYNHNQLCI